MPPEGGEEWKHVFVLRKEHKHKTYSAALEEKAGTVGAAADTVRCVYCGKRGMSAQPQRIRAHIAGFKGQDVSVCPGPPPKAASETTEAFNARRVAFEAARAQMKQLWDELAAAAAEAARKRELDRRTSGVTAAVQQPLFRARNASAAQQEADEKLALAFVTAGLAPNVVENPFVVEMLTAVRACLLAARDARPVVLAPAPSATLGNARAWLRWSTSASRALRATADATFSRLRAQVAAVGPKYAAPGRREVGGSLLESVYVKTKEKVAAMRTGSGLCGQVLVSDGATNERNEPVLNLLSVAAGCGLRAPRGHARRGRGSCAESAARPRPNALAVGALSSSRRQTVAVR